MLNYLALAVVSLISIYTALFSLEVLRKKNYSGFTALIILAVLVTALPFYILFLKP